jgi:hypothetical protein
MGGGRPMTTDVSAGEQVITILDALGISDYVMPFIMIWIVMYGISMRIKIPTARADVNGVTAFAMAYMFVAFGGGKMLNALLPFFIVLFLVLFIALMLYLFLGAKQKQVVKVMTNPTMVLFTVGLLVLFVFIALQDWLIMSDRIPAWQINQSGDLIVSDRIGGEFPGNISEAEGKPHSILVNGVEYELIEGIYYKHGYEGTAYAIGQPQVVAGIFILVIIGVATALVVWPK